MKWRQVLTLLLPLTLWHLSMGQSPEATLCKAAETASRRPVWQGKDGWLFEPADLIETLELEPVQPYLSRLSQAFNYQGITLVAVIVPTRGMVHSEMMDPAKPIFEAHSGAKAVAEYRRFLALFHEANIIAPDLIEVAHEDEGAFFFKRDHHWSSVGARATAEAVARHLYPMPSYIELEIEQETHPFRTKAVGSEPQMGTLQRRAEQFCGVRFPKEYVKVFSTDLVVQGSSPGEALFADLGSPPVALVGTSNSQRPRDKPPLNFDGFLRDYLGLEVLNAAFAAAGVHGSLLAYLSSDDYLEQPPKFVIWESLLSIWHNHESVIGEQRQVIPSIYGPCAPEDSLIQGRVEASNAQEIEVLQNIANLPVYDHNHFLYLEMIDRTLVDFTLVLIHQNGQQDRVRVERSTRAPNSGRFFLELSDEIRAPLESVSLITAAGTSGEIIARICQVPTS